MQRSVYGEVYTRPKHWAVRVSVTWKQKSNAVLSYSAEENQVNTPAYNARAAFSATGTSTALTARKAYSEESRLQKTKNSWHVKRRGLMLYITCFAPANKPRCRKLAKEVDYLLAYVILKP